MGQERQWGKQKSYSKLKSSALLSAMLHLPVPGNSSSGIIFQKMKWVFFSERQKYDDFIIQTKSSHSTALFPGSMAKLKGDKSGSSFAINAYK